MAFAAAADAYWVGSRAPVPRQTPVKPIPAQDAITEPAVLPGAGGL